MKNQAMAVMVAATLLLTASGETMAAGKLGGVGGADEFLFPPASHVGKLGGASGEDIGTLLTEPEDVRSIGIVPGEKLGVGSSEE